MPNCSPPRPGTPVRLDEITSLGALEQIAKIRTGIPTEVFGQVATLLGISQQSLAKKLNVNAQTLLHRTTKMLTPIEGEKCLRVARIFVLASEILGGDAKARRWMFDEIRALGGNRPVELLDIDLGAGEVLNTLNAVKWGVYD